MVHHFARIRLVLNGQAETALPAIEKVAVYAWWSKLIR
jgi:hypothetical protein